ncbi:unnamed protein product [Trichobilharzia regenti]|nr:unnamed protein product [Trichobilharzia regenti]
MVKRLHRQLKAGLSAAKNAHWTDSLLLILLGTRNILKTNAGFTTTELVYGTTPRLPASSHIFVRRRPLEPPYDGPYKFIKRIDKFFVLDKKGREDTVIIDHLKPSYLEGSPVRLELSIHNNTHVNGSEN